MSNLNITQLLGISSPTHICFADVQKTPFKKGAFTNPCYQTSSINLGFSMIFHEFHMFSWLDQMTPQKKSPQNHQNRHWTATSAKEYQGTPASGASSKGPFSSAPSCWFISWTSGEGWRLMGCVNFFLGGGSLNQWLDLRDNLQEPIYITIYSHGIWHLPVFFPLNQAIDWRDAISVANSWLVLGCLGRSTAIHQPGFLIRGWHYPLVNISKKPKKSTISDGKTHYE